MPAKTDTPQTIVLRQLEGITAYEVHEIDILAASNRLRIYWEVGELVTQEDGSEEFQAKERLQAEFDATALAQSNPDGGRTWYANIKEVAYKLLKDNGRLPKDAVVV